MTSSFSWTRTSSHRPDGLQEPEIIQFEQVDFYTGRREATGSIASQERHESCEAEWCIQEHTAQREVVAVEEQRKLAKKSLKIQVEEKQVAEIKNKVRTVKNSLEVTNSSIKVTPR